MAKDLVSHIGPVVATGCRNQNSVIYFTGSFQPSDIRHLMNDIEIVRQTFGYSSVDVYFASNGGFIKDLFVLADYLNGIEDIKVNIIISGMIASCGFYLLPLIDNSNIEIYYNDHAQGMIHLADNMLSQRDQLGDNPTPSKFYKKELEDLNKWLIENVVDHLGLTEDEVNRVKGGEDVYLNCERLELAVKTYNDWRYATSGELVDDYRKISLKIAELQKTKQQLKKQYKLLTGKDLEPKKK